MKKMLGMFGFIIAATLFASGCEKVPLKTVEEEQKAPSEASGPEAQSVGQAPSSLPLAASPGTVATVVVGTVPFSVEIAQTPEERAKGLMGRESIPENGGMFFIFPEAGQEKFWMKDTKIPLDFIYVDDDMKVVHIIENAAPESTELLISPVLFRYVLEIRGGAAAKHGIKIGSTVEKRVGP